MVIKRLRKRPRERGGEGGREGRAWPTTQERASARVVNIGAFGHRTTTRHHALRKISAGEAWPWSLTPGLLAASNANGPPTALRCVLVLSLHDDATPLLLIGSLCSARYELLMSSLRAIGLGFLLRKSGLEGGGRKNIILWIFFRGGVSIYYFCGRTCM